MHWKFKAFLNSCPETKSGNDSENCQQPQEGFRRPSDATSWWLPLSSVGYYQSGSKFVVIVVLVVPREITRDQRNHTHRPWEKTPLSHLWIFWTMNCMYRCNFRYKKPKKSVYVQCCIQCSFIKYFLLMKILIPETLWGLPIATPSFLWKSLALFT